MTQPCTPAVLPIPPSQDEGDGAAVPFAISAGTESASSGTVVFANSNGVTFGMDDGVVTASFSGGAAAAVTGDFYDNGKLLASNQSAMAGSNFAAEIGSLRLARLDMAPFPFDLTASTFMLNLSLSGSTATMSAAFTTSFSVGIYTSTGATLSLVNSASVTFGFAAAATDNSTGFAGVRWLTFGTANWSSLPVFRAGSQYFIATNFSTSGVSNQSATIFAMVQYSNVARSGTIGAAAVAGGTQGFSPFYGVLTATTAAMPASIANSNISKTGGGRFAVVPHVIMHQNPAVTQF